MGLFGVVMVLGAGPGPAVGGEAGALRHRVDPAQAPFAAIGQVNTGARGRCTGVLLRADLAVTAAHCVFNPATGRFLPPASVHFVLGYDRGAYAFQSVARAIRMDGAQNGDRSLAALGRDWALLDLAAPAPASIAPIPLRPQAPAPGTALRAVGFGRDRAYALTVADGCRVEGPAGAHLLAVRCSIISGYSGGPLLDADGRLAAIAVASVGGQGEDMTALGVLASAFASAIGDP